MRQARCDQAASRAEKERRKNNRLKKPEYQSVAWPYARQVADYTYNQLQDMKKGQLVELAKRREQLRNEGQLQSDNFGRRLPRQPTDTEAYALNYHKAVVKMIEDALVPKPPAA